MPGPPDLSVRSGGWTRVAVVVGILAAMATVAVWWGQSVVTAEARIYVTPPGFYGEWELRLPARLWWALPVGLGVMALGEWIRARRPPWWAAAVASSVASAAWMTTLAATEGWAGLTRPLEDRTDYLPVLDRIEGVRPFLADFVALLDDAPVHVRGHPPAMPLLLWGLDRVGLGGARWAAVVIIAVAASGAAALVWVARSVADDDTARAVAPFVGVAPAVVWAAVSADGLFAGVLCWTLAVAAAATRPGVRRPVALGGGGLVGLGAGLLLYLSYGAPLLLVPVAAVVLWRRAWQVAATAAVGAGVVVAAVTAAGFWWFDGLDAVRFYYDLGVGSRRPYGYFVIANLVVAAAAAGPAVVAGTARLCDRRLWVVVGSAVAALVVADLSGLSKAEVERIWLPFVAVIGLGAAGVALPWRAGRWWLAAQLATGVVWQATILGKW